MEHASLVVIYAFGNQMQAEIAKSALASAGIETMIQADSAGGMRPHIAFSTGGFKLLVREEDAVAARAVLEVAQD